MQVQQGRFAYRSMDRQAKMAKIIVIPKNEKDHELFCVLKEHSLHILVVASSITEDEVFYLDPRLSSDIPRPQKRSHITLDSFELSDGVVEILRMEARHEIKQALHRVKRLLYEYEGC